MRVLTAVFIILIPALLSAQTTRPVEVFGHAGIAGFWDDESFIGNGPLVGGGVGIRLPRGWALEASVDRHENDRRFSTSGVHFHADVVSVEGRVLKYFGGEGVQPFFGGGLGIARVEQFTEGITPDAHTRTYNQSLLSVAAGVRAPLGERAFIRPEFEFSPITRMLGLVAIGYRW
jgi:hypothetical protein